MASFQSIATTVPTNGKRVVRITVTLSVFNASGKVYFTDVMFQGGAVATLWTGSPAEMEWSFNG